MRISDEISNLTIELKARYQRIIMANQAAQIRTSNEIIAAIYILSCGSLVVALNSVAGKPWRKVMIDRKTVRVLAVTLSGHAMIDRILYNADQFVSVTGSITERRSQALMNRYLVEWHAVVDDANRRLHVMSKRAAARE